MTSDFTKEEVEALAALLSRLPAALHSGCHNNGPEAADFILTKPWVAAVLDEDIEENEEYLAILRAYAVVYRRFWADHSELDSHKQSSITMMLNFAELLGFQRGKASVNSLGERVERRENLEIATQAKASLRNASSAKRAKSNPVREAARADIAENPKTSQTACAGRVAAKFQRDERGVTRIIAPMFEWRDLPGGGREKRPRPASLVANCPGDPPARMDDRRSARLLGGSP